MAGRRAASVEGFHLVVWQGMGGPGGYPAAGRLEGAVQVRRSGCLCPVFQDDHFDVSPGRRREGLRYGRARRGIGDLNEFEAGSWGIVSTWRVRVTAPVKQYEGIIRGGVVVLTDRPDLSEGTPVLVLPRVGLEDQWLTMPVAAEVFAISPRSTASMGGVRQSAQPS